MENNLENNMDLSPELLEQAVKSPSVSALQALAQENGATLTVEQAAAYYAHLHPETGALSDDELDNVSGGVVNTPLPERCTFCGRTEFTHTWVGWDSRWVCDYCFHLTPLP